MTVVAKSPVLIAAGLLALLAGLPVVGAEETVLAVGGIAPPFTLKTMNPARSGRESVTLGEYVGPNAKKRKKTVVLSFGASYCAPCRVEWARLAARYEALRAAEVELFGVVIDREEAGQREMSKFVDTEIEATFPVLLDRFGILARRYRAQALPYVLLIDGASGQIIEVHVGYEEKILEALIQKLSAGPSKPP